MAEKNELDAGSEPPGAHRGLEPENYVRSDAELQQIIVERLTEAPHIDASHIQAKVHDRHVVLTGAVPSYTMRQAAQELVESQRVSGVDNRLQVVG